MLLAAWSASVHTGMALDITDWAEPVKYSVGGHSVTPCYIDHIIVTAPSLEIGAEYVRQILRVAPQVGGKHPRMGTHNLLLRLGNSLFLEVISPDPDAPSPERPR
jgi:hypothetical protein